MSLITRCPACGTMFKVVPDQLRISEGWVRCGHCTEIFDANGNLQEEALLASIPAEETAVTEPPQQPEPAPPQHPSEEAALPSSAPTTPEAAASHAQTHGDDEFPSSIHSEVDDNMLADFADSQELDEHAQSLRADPLDQPFELRRPGTLEISDVAAPSHFQSTQAPEPDLQDLSFVRQARRKEFWRRPAVRAGLVLAVLTLAALLVLQIAWNDRDRLAAAQPDLRPWLAKLCEAANCTINAPRRIEAIAIDSSSFNKLRADTYRLNVTLKNLSATEVAVPALELTLTDSQDQAVIRRVLPPSEFAARTAALLPGAEWSTSLPLSVSGSGASRIAGYRVLAFYP